MKRRIGTWILALTFIGALGLVGCEKKEETGLEQVKQGVNEMAEEAVKASEQAVQAVKETTEKAVQAVKETAEKATGVVKKTEEDAAEAVKGEHK